MTRTHKHARLTTSRCGLLLAVTFVIFAGDACECDEPVAPIDPVEVPQCLLDTECGDGETYRFGECVRSGCESDADCCPGTRCRVDFNTCWPHQLDAEYACESDSDCPDPAMKCAATVIGDRDPIPTCVYDRCEGDADCGAGTSCFHSVCVATTPCGGGCPAGEVCDVVTNQCHVAPDTNSCSRDCGAQGLLVLADPSTMAGEICCLNTCQCVGRPPLVPLHFGKYSSVTTFDTNVMVSAYDHQFGDLIYVTFKADGAPSRVEYVDGIPVGVEPVADVLGPRGGVVEPGPNVGTHTAITHDSAGNPIISYYDLDNQALKVAISNAGVWTNHTVDDSGVRVGEFNDIAIDDDGRIVISYSAIDVTGAPDIAGTATGLKIARSTSSTPTSASDWALTFADMRPTFDACGGTCGALEACVLFDGAPECRVVQPSCPTSCGGNETCVDDGATGQCAPPPLPAANDGYPRARGLHTSVDTSGTTAIVAHHDSIDQTVRVVTLAGDGTLTSYVIDGDGIEGRRKGRIGRFPAVAKVGGAEVIVVYEDTTRHEVRAWRGELGQAGAFSVVDAGKVEGEAGKRFVGAGTKIAVRDGVNPVVVYQDASTNDLVMAVESGGVWTKETVVSDGAHGYYADVVVGGTNAYIVSVQAQLSGRGQEDPQMGLTIRPLP